MIASLFKSQTFFLPTEFVDKADLPLFVDDPWERKMMLWARRLFQRDVLKYIWETLFGNKFVRTHTLTNLVSYHFHGNNTDWQNIQSQSVCTVSQQQSIGQKTAPSENVRKFKQAGRDSYFQEHGSCLFHSLWPFPWIFCQHNTPQKVWFVHLL